MTTSTSRHKSTAVIVGVITILAVIGIYWWAAVRAANPTFTPTPGEVMQAFWREATSGRLLVNLWASLKRVVIGYSIGMAGAIVLGTLAGWFRPVGYVLNPLIDAIRPIPALAYLPLIILWVGIDEDAKILIIILAAFKTGVVSCRAGMAEIPKIYFDAARMLGANRRQQFTTIALPAAVPYIVAGARVSFTTCWLALVAAELVAANEGLGFMISNAGHFFQTDVVFVGIITIGVVAFVLDRSLHAAGKAVTRWSENV